MSSLLHLYCFPAIAFRWKYLKLYVVMELLIHKKLETVEWLVPVKDENFNEVEKNDVLKKNNKDSFPIIL